MAAVNFPNNPSVNDTHTSSGSTWKWDGTVWQRLGVAGPQGAQGVQGAAGSGGAAGAQGAQGRQGATGSNGAAGAQGAQGHQGVQGAAGAQGAQGVVSDAIQNTKAGTNAGGNFSGSNAVGNTLYGWGAGQALTTGDENVYIGHLAGKASDGQSHNIGIGYSVLQANNGGGNNVMIGQEVAVNATDVQNSICIGDRAGYWGISDYAVVIGKSVGYSNPNDHTIAIGEQAGYSNAGEHCISLGYQAGYNSGGKYGVNIGYNAGYSQSSNNKGNVAIGYHALKHENGNEYCVGIGNSCYLPIKGENTGASDNQLVIGVGHTAWIYGTKNYNIGLGITNPGAVVHAYHATSNTIAQFESGDAGAGAIWKDNSTYSSIEQNGTDFIISADQGASHANSALLFKVDSSEKLRIKSDGKVVIGNTSGSGTGALTIYPNSLTGNGRLDVYGGGDENSQTQARCEVMRIGRGDILDQYYHSIWSATGSGGSTSHFLKFYVSNGNAGATNQLEALSMNGNGQVQIIQTTQSTSKDTGALVVEGGVGIEKNVYVGGALNVTGNTNLSAELRANANIRMTNAGPKITFVDSDHNPDYEVGNSDGVFRIRDTTSSVNRLTIESDGEVHIIGGGDKALGNTNTKGNLFVADGGTAAQTAGEGGTISLGAWLGGDTSAPYTMAAIKGISESGTTNINTGALLFATREQGGGPYERLRITSGGEVLIGRTTKQNSDSTVEIQDATNTYVRITSGNTTGSTGVIFGTSDDHSTGGIFYDGSNDTLSLAGHNNTTRLTIDSTGALGVGYTPKNNSGNFTQLQIGLGAHFYGRTDDTAIYISSNAYRDGSNWKYTANTTASQMGMGTHITFYTASSGTAGNNISWTDVMRLENDGDWMIGSDWSNTLWDSGSESGVFYRKAQGSFAMATPSSTGYSNWYMNKNTGGGTSDNRWIDFYYNGSSRDKIWYNNSGNVAFGGYSDYRLKENITEMDDGIVKVKQLKPSYYTWKKGHGRDECSDIKQSGFIAHEIQSVLPNLVDGTKDQVVTQEEFDAGTQPEESAVGTPIYQSVDYQKITPILTAAIKELITKVETLEAEVAALKSG